MNQILQDPHDERTTILTIAPDKTLTCPIDHRPCQPEVVFGDHVKCRYYWGSEVVRKKCAEWRGK